MELHTLLFCWGHGSSGPPLPKEFRDDFGNGQGRSIEPAGLSMLGQNAQIGRLVEEFGHQNNTGYVPAR
jgi:hypothetical protein